MSRYLATLAAVTTLALAGCKKSLPPAGSILGETSGYCADDIHGTHHFGSLLRSVPGWQVSPDDGTKEVPCRSLLMGYETTSIALVDPCGTIGPEWTFYFWQDADGMVIVCKRKIVSRP